MTETLDRGKFQFRLGEYEEEAKQQDGSSVAAIGSGRGIELVFRAKRVSNLGEYFVPVRDYQLLDSLRVALSLLLILQVLCNRLDWTRTCHSID